MKTVLRFSGLLAVLSVLFFACQKEVSFEQGNVRVSVGSLQADGTGGCLGATVLGTYKKDTALNAANYVNINVNVDTAGSYTISSDTVNGYYFRATGNFTATGVQVVKLVGGGKPLNTGTNIFTVTYNGTTCEFSVTVTAGTGGTGAFTLNGAPGNCTGAVVNGTYTEGTALTATNTVVLNVNVTAIGTWSLSTAPAVNGIIFSGSGTFTMTGAQTITLTGSGTPLTGGTFNIPVTVGANTCTFPVTCMALPDYFPRTTYSNWSYEIDGDANDSLLLKVIVPTHSAIGNFYKIFMYTDPTTALDTFGYYRRSGPDYYEWIDMGTYLGFDGPIWLEYNFLKDNLAASATWPSVQFSGTVSGNPVTARLFYTILQKDVSVTVTSSFGNITYNNTIVVKEELQQLVGANWVTLTAAGYNQHYYARDKGLIKSDYYDGTATLFQYMDVRRLVIY